MCVSEPAVEAGRLAIARRIQREALQPALDLHPRLAELARDLADVAAVLDEERVEPGAQRGVVRILGGRAREVRGIDRRVARERERGLDDLVDLARVVRPRGADEL